MDDGSLLALAALLLEVEVLLKDGGEAVPFQHARLMDHLLLIGWDGVQVIEQGHVVAFPGADVTDTSVTDGNRHNGHSP